MTYFHEQLQDLKSCDHECDINLHFGEYKNLYEGIDMTNYLCIPLNTTNNTLFGNLGDYVNGYSRINFYFLYK